MKQFDLYVLYIRQSETALDLRAVIERACQQAVIAYTPDKIRKNLGLLKQLLEMADEKLQEFEADNEQ